MIPLTGLISLERPCIGAPEHISFNFSASLDLSGGAASVYIIRQTNIHGAGLSQPLSRHNPRQTPIRLAHGII